MSGTTVLQLALLILALAIASEDEDARTYSTFAHQLMEKFPASAKVFVEMAEEEHEHRRGRSAQAP